jgi:prepilin-type N-terminal cleavage/methylation domain-containing protein
MEMKRGFTLIELLVVIIIIGILATLAVPQYLTATERAKSGKARHAIGLIAQAEKLYRGDRDTYINVPNKAALLNSPGLSDYIELVDISRDLDWNYNVSGATSSVFLITATRLAGSDLGTITFAQDGVWGGTRRRRVGGEAP